MHIRSIVFACVAVVGLGASPAFATSLWTCINHDNAGVKGFGTGTSPTQPCRDLIECPVPSQFLSLSSQASGTFAFDDPDTHQDAKRNPFYPYIGPEYLYVGEIEEGGCAV